MNDQWKQQVLELLNWKDKQDALRYSAVVEEAKYQCDLDTCRYLMRTFVTDDDYGVQECVFSVLSTAKPQHRQLALLEELPRLMLEAPEMARDLINVEIKFYPDSFRETLARF